MDRRRKRIIAFLQRSSALGRKEDTGRRGGRDDRDPIGRKGRLSFVSLSLSLSLLLAFIRLVQCSGRCRGIRSSQSLKVEEGGATVRLLFAEPSISDRCSAVHGALLPSPPHPPPLPKSSS